MRAVGIHDVDSLRPRISGDKLRSTLPHWALVAPGVPETHRLTVLDISDPKHRREVSRVTFDAGQKRHSVALDPSGTRVVLNSEENGPDHRLFVVNFDPNTGSVKLDERFRDLGSDRPEVSMDGKSGPDAFHGNAYAHGTVFSRRSRTLSYSDHRPPSQPLQVIILGTQLA